MWTGSAGRGGGRRNEEHMGWLDTSHLPWRMIMWTRNAGERNEEHTGWVDISHFPRSMILWTGSAEGGEGMGSTRLALNLPAVIYNSTAV